MARDEALAGEATPTVRIFCWRPPALSWGFRQLPPAWVATAVASVPGLEGVERPTGGGLALHGSDVSLSVVVPRGRGPTLKTLLQAVCASAVQICRSYGVEADATLTGARAGRVTYCLAEPSPYAVRVAGRKLAGFALRRYPETWLIQGSLLVASIPPAIRDVVPAEVMARTDEAARPLAQAAGRRIDPEDAAHRWAGGWVMWWDAASIEACVA